MTYTTNKCQKDVSDYTITLLNSETIKMVHVYDEDIDERKNDEVSICLHTATYVSRLYDAFKNKELIKCISRKCKEIDITTGDVSEREFEYNNYFKIVSFSSNTELESPSKYYVVFETIE